ncbi:MAG: ribosome hibernation-promoting factor, HPF/YfiA family [Flavobacteriales bacterium]
MKVRFTAVHFSADQKLINFIEAKIMKLGTFYGKIIDGEVFLRLDKSDDTQNKIVEIKLNAPGTALFAKKKSKSFEEAADSVVEALKKQISKHKTKESLMDQSQLSGL